MYRQHEKVGEMAQLAKYSPGKYEKQSYIQDPIRINNGGAACDNNLRNREVETGASLVSMI